jgi:hypothetical protein
MDHATATRHATAEAYVLGELGDEQRAAFEEHFFTCPECAEEVKALAVFVDDARSILAKEPASRRLATAARRLLPGPWRPLTALPLAATVLLLFGVTVYQSTVTVPRLRHELAQARAPQATSWHFLTVARSDPPEVQVSKHQRMIGLTLSRSGYESHPRYRVDVRDAEGTQVLSTAVPAPPAGDELQLLLPVAELRAGRYALVLSGLGGADDAASAPDLARYPFILTREE